MQLCQAHPTDLAGLRATLGTASTLEGVRLQVTARNFRQPRTATATIRTIPVRTHPNGVVEIIAASGAYRFQVMDNGVANIHVKSREATYVEVTGVADVTVDVTEYVNVTALNGTVRVNANTGGWGVVRHQPPAKVTVTGPCADNIRRVVLHSGSRVHSTVRSVETVVCEKLTAAGLRDANTWGWS